MWILLSLCLFHSYSTQHHPLYISKENTNKSSHFMQISTWVICAKKIYVYKSKFNKETWVVDKIFVCCILNAFVIICYLNIYPAVGKYWFKILWIICDQKSINFWCFAALTSLNLVFEYHKGFIVFFSRIEQNWN